MPSTAAISSEVSVALSRGVSPRPQAFVAQADAQPFAALLDVAASPAPDSGAGAPAAAAQPNQQKPAADTGAAAQNSAAASALPRPAGDGAHGAAASDNGASVQSANAATTQGAAADNTDSRKPIPSLDGNNSAGWAPPAAANGTPIQTALAAWTHQAAAKNGGDLKLGPNPNTNKVAITLPLPRAAGIPIASSGASANPTRNGSAPVANDPAAPDAPDAGQSASDNSAAARLAAVIADLNGAASSDGVTPGGTPPSGGGKDDQKAQQNGAADAAAVSPAAGQAQAPSPAPTQPLAAAMAVNPGPDSAPPAAAKPALAIADAGKARAKIMLMPAATGKATPPQDDSTDGPGSSSAADSGNSGAAPAPAGSEDGIADASIANAQQVIDQLPAFTATSATLLTQTDFSLLGGMERFGLRGETATSVNGAVASAAPSGAPNAAMAPNFGIFAPNAIATNLAAPAATAEPAVPLAGLAVAIAGRAQAGSSQFDIRLDPPELGRIDVRLDVDGSGQVRTHVTVDRADTLQLLQSQQPQLERALEQAGLTTADNGLQFTLRDQSFAGQNGQTGGQHYANQPAAPLVIPETDAAPIDTAQIYARLRLGNGLDISV